LELQRLEIYSLRNECSSACREIQKPLIQTSRVELSSSHSVYQVQASCVVLFFPNPGTNRTQWRGGLSATEENDPDERRRWRSHTSQSRSRRSRRRRAQRRLLPSQHRSVVAFQFQSAPSGPSWLGRLLAHITPPVASSDRIAAAYYGFNGQDDLAPER
jgi:hypothetical protein